MELYWLLRFPHLNSFCCGVSVILFFTSVIFLIASVYSFIDEEYFKPFIPYRLTFSYFAIASMLFAFTTCFIPTKQDLAIMMGWDAIKSDSVQEVIEILKEKLDNL